MPTSIRGSWRGGQQQRVAIEVLGVYVLSDAIDPSNLHIYQKLMDVVGRMGGHTYTRTRGQFDIKTLTKKEWDCRKKWLFQIKSAPKVQISTQ